MSVPSVRVRMTYRVRHLREVLGALIARPAEGLEKHGILGADGIDRVNHSLKRIERYWSDQIRYIY